VTHHTLTRMRRRLDALFVALHAAHVRVQGELARVGEPCAWDPELLVDLPSLGLGRFLGAAVVRWMLAAPPVATDAPPIAQLQDLLLAPPAPVRRDALAGTPPLAWQAHAHRVLEAAHHAVEALAAAAATRGEHAAAIEILEAFCAHAEASSDTLDVAAIEARCTEALWACWLAAWFGAARSSTELERRLGSRPRLLGAIERSHPRLVARVHDTRARALAAENAGA
jgi:hypothetical protein